MKLLTTAIQEGILALICFDNSPTANVVRSLVPARQFDPYYRDLAESAIDYHEKYKKPPGEHTMDLVDTLKARKEDSAEMYDRILDSLNSVKRGLDGPKGLNRKYLFDKVSVFVRTQRMKANTAKIIGLGRKAETGDETALLEAEAIMASAGRGSSLESLSPGLLLNDPTQALSFYNRDETDFLPLGIPELDRYKLGPARKKYHLTLADTGTGKSWFAVHIGKMGIRHGYKVMHISCEMSQEEVVQRYVQAICSVSLDEADVIIRRFDKDELGRIIGHRSRELKRLTLNGKNAYARLLKKLEPLRNRPKLWVKDFPSGTLTVRTLKAYMDYMEGAHSFIPDILIVDYPDLFDHDTKHQRNELTKIAVDLRGIGGARNMMVCGFSQVNETKQGKIIRTGRASEGRGKEHTADIILSLNQTEAEYDLGFTRIAAPKVRGNRKNMKVLVSQNLAIGQFAIDSALMAEDTYWNMIENADDTDEDFTDED